MNQDDFCYVFVKNGPDVSKEEIENNQQLCQVKIFWGNNLLHIANLTNKSFIIGETKDCDYQFPISNLGLDKLKLVSFEDDKFVVNDLTKSTILQLGDNVNVNILDFTFEVKLENSAKTLGSKINFDKALAIFNSASLTAHLSIILSMFLYMPSVEGLQDAEISNEQLLLMQQYLAAAAEKEEKQEELKNIEQTNISGGETGARSKGNEGAMGNPTSSANNRYAVAGPQSNTDPHIAKQRMLQEAADFGLVGLLSNMGGDPNSITAPWGRDTALGNDPISANGALWGSEIGEGFGAGGLGLTGLGEAGGGPGEGVGLGKNIGGLGNNLHAGFDSSRTIKGKYSPKDIKMRVGATNTSGRIPAETIQRVIRQNFGRFRSCYEAGLKNNPSLSGRVGVRFIIGRNGDVGQVNNGGSDLPDSGVVNCVVNAFKGLSFPQPEEGIVTVGYSIQFSPN
jgi:hypothetical protein